MLPCLVAALNDQLNKSDGNETRLAIACEALSCGKSRAEVINLFTGQDDFIEATTARYVDFIIVRGCHR
ncbi:MAG: hypothetical protein MUO26_07895 [Methanotrichaceae archaeon]|nr:hypothetical protein [Methanotrichaceae archaeon]